VEGEVGVHCTGKCYVQHTVGYRLLT